MGKDYVFQTFHCYNPKHNDWSPPNPFWPYQKQKPWISLVNWLSHSLSKRSPLSSYQCSHSHSQLKTLLLLFKFYWSIADLDFPSSSAGKESTCNAGDPVLIPGSGWSPGEGHGNPLQYSCLENPRGQRSQFLGSQRIRHDWVTDHTAHSWFTMLS